MRHGCSCEVYCCSHWPHPQVQQHTQTHVSVCVFFVSSHLCCVSLHVCVRMVNWLWSHDAACREANMSALVCCVGQRTNGWRKAGSTRQVAYQSKCMRESSEGDLGFIRQRTMEIKKELRIITGKICTRCTHIHILANQSLSFTFYLTY